MIYIFKTLNLLYISLNLIIFALPVYAQEVNNKITVQLEDTYLNYPNWSWTNDKDNDQYRPQFHFTAATGTISDPNGLVYYDGTYHLFFQHNPDNVKIPVPQHWGHATSKDLVHWERQPIAISPHDGGNIWSGSSVVDHNNTSGLQKGSQPPILAFYTWHKNFTQRMVYSNDGAETWTEYNQNPVLEHIYGNNRDPKVFWHEDSNKWIMVLYIDKRFDFFSSDDLKGWTYLSTSDLEVHECPDFFELPVDGDVNNKKWVMIDAAGTYYIGEFDGMKFKPKTGPHLTDWNNTIFYATQTWNNIPEEDGRRIQIAALRDDRAEKIPSKYFKNQMTFPANLTIHSTDDGMRLYRYPIREIEKLYSKQSNLEEVQINDNEKKLIGRAELADIKLRINVGSSKKIQINVRGEEIEYVVDEQKINFGTLTAPLKTNTSTIEIRLLIDWSSIEFFGNKGEMSISKNYIPVNDDIYIKSSKGVTIIESLEINELNSIWEYERN